MNPSLVTINDIVNIHNSYTTLFAKLNRNPGNFGIVFHDPAEKRVVQLFDSSFAGIFREVITDFPLGMATGSIVGLARERTPADLWHSDTIERDHNDKNSLHQGIRRIVEQEDGIPVYMNSLRVIGNISPALAYSLKGNPVKIQQLLRKYNRIQKHILHEIGKGKPRHNSTAISRSYSAGEGYKAESRLQSIRARLNALSLSPEAE